MLTGARRHWEEGTCTHLPSLENVVPYKARFASFTTFWFAPKEPKSLQQDTLHQLKIYLNCYCDPGCAPDHTGGAYSTPTDPLAVFKGSASQQRRNGRVDRAGRKGWGGEEKNGETGEGIICSLLQKFLRAPMHLSS